MSNAELLRHIAGLNIELAIPDEKGNFINWAFAIQQTVKAHLQEV